MLLILRTLFLFQLAGTMNAEKADKILTTLNRAILQTIDEEIMERDRLKRNYLWHKELALRRMRREWLKSKQPRVEEPEEGEVKKEVVEIEEISEPEEKRIPDLDDDIEDL